MDKLVRWTRMGDMIEVAPGILAERAPRHLFRLAHPGRCLKHGTIPFVARMPDGKLAWWAVPAGAVIAAVGNTGNRRWNVN